MTILLEANLTLFFGRFHPLLVHLPIGFIILAGIFEMISWKKKVDLQLAIAYALLAGAIFGMMAIVLGLMLASEGGYNESALNTHKWTGIATTILSLAAYLLKKNLHKAAWMQKAYQSTLLLALITLTMAGHYGGSLTHGSTYLLEHAPGPVRQLAGLKPARERVTVMDSALVYDDVIHYMFEAKCNVCHNPDKQKGALLLTEPAHIMKGGDSGPVIVPGDASQSELFLRVTLNPDHDDFMPAEGRTPLTKEETSLLEWWIEEGAPFDKKVVELSREERINGYLREVGIGEKKSFLASLAIASVAREVQDEIVAEGFKLKTIATDSPWLEASYSSYNPDKLSEQKLSTLTNAKENITWLTLSRIPLKDDWLSHIGRFTNLTKLWLNQTAITDEGIKHLVQLKNLEYLNLYGTKLTDEAITDIRQLSGLKKLYIWQTDITEEGVAQIKESLPEVEVVYQYPSL